MKLTYWCARVIDDSDCYSVRERTKRDALAALARSGSKHEPLRKVVVEYRDGFDLMSKFMGEGGPYWEEQR